MSSAVQSALFRDRDLFWNGFSLWVPPSDSVTSLGIVSVIIRGLLFWRLGILRIWMQRLLIVLNVRPPSSLEHRILDPKNSGEGNRPQNRLKSVVGISYIPPNPKSPSFTLSLGIFDATHLWDLLFIQRFFWGIYYGIRCIFCNRWITFVLRDATDKKVHIVWSTHTFHARSAKTRRFYPASIFSWATYLNKLKTGQFYPARIFSWAAAVSRKFLSIYSLIIMVLALEMCLPLMFLEFLVLEKFRQFAGGWCLMWWETTVFLFHVSNDK